VLEAVKGGLMESKRLLGITVLGVIDIIFGIIGLPFLICGFGSVFLSILNIFNQYAIMYLLFGIPFVLGGGLGVVLIMAGVWKLKLKEKGRKISLYLSPLIAIAMCFALPFIGIGRRLSSTITNLAYLLIPVIFLVAHLWYLTRPKVKEQFK